MEGPGVRGTPIFPMICPQCLGRHSDFLFGAGTSPPFHSAVRHTLVPAQDKYIACYT